MAVSRRAFMGISALAALSGCARVKQSRIGRLAPALEFGGDGVAKFAAIGDLHLTGARSTGLVGRAVNRINNEPGVDFVVVLGDLTENGALSQMNLARQALDRLRMPVYALPGEHDLGSGTEDPYAFYTRTFGKSQWRQNLEGWAFIGLDTCDGASGTPETPASRLEWLQNQLSHMDKKKPITLFTHHPLEPGIPFGRPANADDILALFAAHNLRICASGHYHGNRAEEHNGILFTSTAAGGSNAKNDDGTDEKGFRLFTLKGAEIQHEFIAVT
ncbi:MAG: metallophosphoesterase [Candidatus Hydrogenedentes bacterium]|nr:metallophosphoesterase [Candidatus Hydrogenedentota bacterium]